MLRWNSPLAMHSHEETFYGSETDKNRSLDCGELPLSRQFPSARDDKEGNASDPWKFALIRGDEVS
jgi:hypothetical protein